MLFSRKRVSIVLIKYLLFIFNKNLTICKVLPLCFYKNKINIWKFIINKKY